MSLPLSGGLFATDSPDERFLSALHGLVESRDEVALVARRLRDDRFEEGAWERVLLTELLQLFRWSIRRLAEPSREDAGGGRQVQVLSLLPRYGAAVHVLRRAVPFAALGVPTACSFPADGPDRAREVDELASRLNLRETLTWAREPSPVVLRRHADRGWPVVLTGRSETLAAVRTAASASPVLAATGHCSVVLGATPDSVAAFSDHLARSQPAVSCTRLGAHVVADGLSPSSTIEAQAGPLARAGGETVGEALGRLHPSVVFISGSSFRCEVPNFLCGYRCVDFERGQVTSEQLEGFGADPVGGWPGDYLL